MTTNNSDTDIAAVAVRLLARREHSTAELRRKLQQRSFPVDAVEPLLEHLTADGLLSDERFVEQFVRSCRRRGQGPLRIRAALHERGVGDDLIDRGLPQDPADWWPLLREVHDRRYGASLPEDYKELARRARFLQQRGFDAALVHRLLAGKADEESLGR